MVEFEVMPVIVNTDVINVVGRMSWRKLVRTVRLIEFILSV